MRSLLLTISMFFGMLLVGPSSFAAKMHRPEKALDISGKWIAACHRLNRGQHVEEIYSFGKDGTWTREQRIYSDEDCATDAVDEVKTFSGRYHVVGTASAVGSNAFKIDLFVDHVYDMPVSGAAVAKFTQSALCHLTDWKAGVKRDVTGMLCSGRTISAGTRVYDVLVKDAGQNKLYFGDPSFYSDMSRRKGRPTRVDKSVAFDLQS